MTKIHDERYNEIMYEEERELNDLEYEVLKRVDTKTMRVNFQTIKSLCAKKEPTDAELTSALGHLVAEGYMKVYRRKGSYIFRRS